jgi:hypothetical protein
MALSFERGEQNEPRGHALLYFHSSKDRSVIMATYLVVPPVPLNLSRYMPPMFAANMPAGDVQSISAVPLPPLPEQVESLAYLQQLAENRKDDLIYGGTLDPDDLQRGLLVTSEAAQDYLQIYNQYASRQPRPADEPTPALDVSYVLYELMSEGQRLGELAKLTGKLRYAVEGADKDQVAETVVEMQALSRHLGEKYRVDDLIESAQVPGRRGQRLSQLYVDRCYRLFEEDYDSLQAIDAEITSIKQQEQ